MKKQIAKCIKEISSGAYSPQVVFFDWMQCLALSISNTCTLIHNDLWKKREEQYLSTIRKYDKEARYKMSDMVGMLTATYEDTGLSDVLGEVYMESVGGNKNTGQFFTPYHVSLRVQSLLFQKTSTMIGYRCMSLHAAAAEWLSLLHRFCKKEGSTIKKLWMWFVRIWTG